MKDAFEGEESKGDVDMIQNLIMWIYQTEDVEKLEQMLNLAMSSNSVPPIDQEAPEQEKKEETTADLSTSITPSITTPALGGSQANNFQVAMLNQKIEQLEKEKAKLDEEKKLADEEITQLNRDIYKLNEKILHMQMNDVSVSPIKGAGGAGANDLSYSLTHDKVEIEAIQRFYDLKDANIRRQTDTHKLRAKLENLQCDFKIYQTSNKIKL